jgi:hypothetical protein
MINKQQAKKIPTYIIRPTKTRKLLGATGNLQENKNLQTKKNCEVQAFE